MSEQAGYEVPLDEVIVDWSMQQAEVGNLGQAVPALVAKWWREIKPTTEAMEPALIESEALEPLLSTGEKPLVRLDSSTLDEKLPEILGQSKNEKEA
jgi:hypothetical protein